MNERGKQALVNAQMRGVRQLRGRLYDGEGGFCAGGVLLEAMGLMDRDGWIGSLPNGTTLSVFQVFGLDEHEWERMVTMNNAGADFIKIARELPDSEAPVVSAGFFCESVGPS